MKRFHLSDEMASDEGSLSLLITPSDSQEDWSTFPVYNMAQIDTLNDQAQQMRLH